MKFTFRKPPLVALVILLTLSAGALAGSLTPPGAVSSTMNSLEDLYASIAGTFDSTSIVANQNGSLIQHLKYIESQSAWASSSNDIWNLNSGNVGIGTTTPAGLLSLQQPNNTANMLVANRFSDNSATSGSFFKLRGAGNQLIAMLDTKGGFTSNIASISPTIVGSVTSGTLLDGPDAVYVSGRYAYVAALQADALAIIDISNPASPSIRASITSSQLDGANSVTVAGRYAYVTALNDNRFLVIDVSKPTSPVIVGSVQSGTYLNQPDGVRVSGRYAYVAAGTSDALTVIDISNPANPTIAGSVTTASLDGANDVYVVGGYAYVSASNGNRLTVVDISDPANPTIVSSVQDATNLASIQSVYVSGRYAYIAAAGATSRMTVVDVSNPASPTVVASLVDTTLLAGVNWVTVAGRYAYLTAGSGVRMTIVDVSNPLIPRIAGSVRSTTNLGLPRAVFVSGRYAYVTAFGGDRLNIIDVSGFDIPTLLTGTIQTSTLEAWDNVDIGNNLNVRSGLNVGIGGIMTTGRLGVASESYFAGNVGIGTTSVDANFEIRANSVTTGSIASISATALVGGSVFNITIPASTSANNSHGLMLVQNVSGTVIASWSMGGALSIAGAIRSDGAVSNCTSVNIPSSGCIDYAESYPTTDSTLQAGELVSIDPANSQHVIRASPASSVVGIISTNPAALIDANGLKTGSLAKSSLGTVPVALAGRVPVKITGHVSAGDHLTLSSTPGIAQTATSPGMTIGIALESSDGLTVMTFVNTGYWAPEVAVSATVPDSPSLIDMILNYLKDAVLSVRRLVVHDEVCIGETCVNENQLKQLLQNASISPSIPSPSDMPLPSDIPTPSDTTTPSATPTPDPTEIPSTP